MPIPKPKPGEGKDDFIGRCMDAIGGEYEDKDQAVAICYDAWRNKGADEVVHRILDCEVREVGDPSGRTLEFVGSDETVDSFGDVLEVAGWELGRYERNPVFLWAHKYDQPPVGKALAVGKGDKLTFQVQFAPREVYPFADTVYKLYKHGFLRATSVGFYGRERDPITDDEGRQTGWRFKRQELLELSAVPVPANPNALVMAVRSGAVSAEDVEWLTGVPFERGLADPEGWGAEMAAREALWGCPADGPLDWLRGALPFHAYPKAPEDDPWDGPAEVAKAEVADLRKMCAWVDGAGEKKGDFKLPHHRADGYATVWGGVRAAMGALLGARGGTNVPDGDRRAVYGHLAKHYAQFGKEPPEFKAAGEPRHGVEGAVPPVGGGRPGGDLVAALADLAREVREIKDLIGLYGQCPYTYGQSMYMYGQCTDNVCTLSNPLPPQGGGDLYDLALRPAPGPDGRTTSHAEGAEGVLRRLRDIVARPRKRGPAELLEELAGALAGEDDQ